jgi:hypothetical protein
VYALNECAAGYRIGEEQSAAGLPTTFSLGGCATRGLVSYRLYQRETSLEMRQVFVAAPDDKLVERRGARYA